MVNHTATDADSDWVAVGPPINGTSKFWGLKEPPTTTFPVDQMVTVCSKIRPSVDYLKTVALTEGRRNKDQDDAEIMTPATFYRHTLVKVKVKTRVGFIITKKRSHTGPS